MVNGSAWAKLVGCYDLFCDRQWVRQAVSSSGWSAPFIFEGFKKAVDDSDKEGSADSAAEKIEDAKK